MIIDTHAHLYAKQFDEDREEMIARAKQEGVERIYLPNIDSTSIDSMLELEKKEEGYCFAMMGLHPCSVKENYLEELKLVEKHLADRPFVAIGEIGIDLYWDKTTLDIQKQAFRTQIQWAKELKLPIVIHARDSLEEILEIVEAEKTSDLRGIFHCFTGNKEQAKRVIDLNFLMGLGGVLTFKNSGIDQVVKEISLDHFVLETDAPYLSPVPFRGKRNESAYILHVADKLSDIMECTIEEIGKKTTENALNLFEN